MLYKIHNFAVFFLFSLISRHIRKKSDLKTNSNFLNLKLNFWFWKWHYHDYLLCWISLSSTDFMASGKTEIEEGQLNLQVTPSLWCIQWAFEAILIKSDTFFHFSNPQPVVRRVLLKHCKSFGFRCRLERKGFFEA